MKKLQGGKEKKERPNKNSKPKILFVKPFLKILKPHNNRGEKTFLTHTPGFSQL